LGAAVSLDITATPDQNHQPYVVRAKVSGIFAAPPGISAEAFREFCNEAAPTILFPFVRQKIVDASADAPFGPIVLNPVNLRAHFQAVRDAAAKELLESKSL
jgi:preprotein translocase subunit SecB